MPAKPTWFLRIPHILEQLRGMDGVPLLDRPTFESLFEVRRRRAHQLMGRFGGFQIGRSYLVDRKQVIRMLERVAKGEEFSEESRRKARVMETLEVARRHLAGRRVEIVPAAPPPETPGLPPGVHIEDGSMRIEFRTTEELLKRLFELSQAILADYESFRERIEGGQG
jgi:hypothetical protein